jgi:hypothetical protein
MPRGYFFAKPLKKLKFKENIQKKLAVLKTNRGLPPVKNAFTLFFLFSRSRALNLKNMGQGPTGKESVKKRALSGEKKENEFACFAAERWKLRSRAGSCLTERASKEESRVSRLLYII